MSRSTRVITVISVVLAAAPLAVADASPVGLSAGRGWAVAPFATGFPNSGGEGPTGVAMSPSGRLYVADVDNGDVYAFGVRGGKATRSRLPDAALSVPIDLAFTPGGQLYASEEDTGSVVQLNPRTGAFIRTVTTGLEAADGLAVDPVTGDLFVSVYSTFGTVQRISGLGSATPTVTQYATGFTLPDGIAFGPGGTLYVSDNDSAGTVWAVQGTSAASPGTMTSLGSTGGSSGPDGISVGNGFIVVNRNDGVMTRISLGSGHKQTRVFSGGSRGDISTVGTDGCIYATQTDRVVRVTNSDGSCSMAPDVLFAGPTSVARGASRVRAHAALLHATLNAGGHRTTYRFAWGASPALGHLTGKQHLAGGTTARKISAKLTKLRGKKRYYFRVLAQNSRGTTASTLGAFRTR